MENIFESYMMYSEGCPDVIFVSALRFIHQKNGLFTLSKPVYAMVQILNMN